MRAGCHDIPRVLRLSGTTVTTGRIRVRGRLHSIQPAKRVPPTLIPLGSSQVRTGFIIRHVESLVRRNASPDRVTILCHTRFRDVRLRVRLAHKRVPFHVADNVEFFRRTRVGSIITFVHFIIGPESRLSFHHVMVLLPNVNPKVTRGL